MTHAMPADLAEILAEVVPPGGAFRHRQHIHLAFLTVRRHGGARAAELISRWIRHITVYERAPQKYNASVTDFETFAERNPALLDKRLLNRHYTSTALSSAAARAGWIMPDVAPFPWSDNPGPAANPG